jgi:hypothetical protein
MIAQSAILILSAIGIWLLSCRGAGRAGWAVGLCAQPFWLWETWHAAQWGMFANALVFTAIYLRGLVNHWSYAE